MSPNKFKEAFGFVPRSGTGLVVFIVIIVLAFSVGMLIQRGKESAPGGMPSSELSGAIDEKAEPSLWTCSMHPEIKLPQPGKCPICFMELIPLETADAGEELGARQLKMTESAVRLADIQTAPVRRHFVEAEIRMVGTIAFDETRVAYTTAWVPGRLDRLFVNYTGIKVERGDRMVEIYSPQLLSAQEELIQAKQAVTTLSGSTNEVLKRTAAATLDAAREKLRLLGLNERQIQNIETSGRTETRITIYAPIGGVVLHKNAKEGMYVDTGTQIYTIADLSELWVLFDAYQSDLPWLREGQKVEFTSLSFPGEKFAGTITFIDPVLNDATKTARVRAVVNNKDGRLKPDMFVSGIIKSRLDKHGRVVDVSVVDTAEPPLVVPASAPLITGSRAVVYVRSPDAVEPVFEGREIVLGPRSGDYYIVKSGLAEGELVVVNGAFKIDSELQIRAKPSMMNPEGGLSGSVHHHDQGTVQPRDEGGEADKHDHRSAKEKPDRRESQGEEREGVSVEALRVLTPLYHAYFEVQMALAGDDNERAVEANKKLMQTLKRVDMRLFRGTAHARWMELSAGIDAVASKGASAADIAESRLLFMELSRTFIELHEAFGHEEDKDYSLAYCPMADGDGGAYWLQPVDTVYNSFYGAAMLRCGSIERKLPPVRIEDK